MFFLFFFLFFHDFKKKIFFPSLLRMLCVWFLQHKVSVSKFSLGTKFPTMDAAKVLDFDTRTNDLVGLISPELPLELPVF